eukprot:819302-Prorocentrum_minimum.AAC.1
MLRRSARTGSRESPDWRNREVWSAPTFDTPPLAVRRPRLFSVSTFRDADIRLRMSSRPGASL